MINGESKYVLITKVIVHATTVKITVAKYIYASIARMSGNVKCPSGNFGKSSQLTNWILDSGAMYHMTPEVSDFIPGFLKDTDKNI